MGYKPCDMEKLSFEAHLRYRLATDIGGFLFGALLLIIVTRIRFLLPPLAIVLIIVALGLGFALDVALWLYRGIRSVELEDAAITLYRGVAMKRQRIEKEKITRIRIVRRLGRRTAVLQLSTLHAARINEEAFPRESFGRLLSALQAWAADPSRN